MLIYSNWIEIGVHPQKKSNPPKNIKKPFQIGFSEAIALLQILAALWWD